MISCYTINIPNLGRFSSVDASCIPIVSSTNAQQRLNEILRVNNKHQYPNDSRKNQYTKMLIIMDQDGKSIVHMVISSGETICYALDYTRCGIALCVDITTSRRRHI